MLKKMFATLWLLTLISLSSVPAFSQTNTFIGFLCGAGQPGRNSEEKPVIIRIVDKNGKVMCFEIERKLLQSLASSGRQMKLGSEVRLVVKNKTATRISLTGKTNESVTKCRYEDCSNMNLKSRN